MAISGVFSPVATGLFFEKTAKNSHFWPKSLKIAILAVFTHKTPFLGVLGLSRPPTGGGFTSTPARAARPGGSLPGGPETLWGPGIRDPGSGGPGGLVRPWLPGPSPGGDPGNRGSGVRGPGTTGPAYGVLHQPLAPGPCPRQGGVSGTGPGTGSPGPLRRPFSNPRPWRASDPIFRPPGRGQGPAARG